MPTIQPTEQPTEQPTQQPTPQPTEKQTINPSHLPTTAPTVPTRNPSVRPSGSPTSEPTEQPTESLRPTDSMLSTTNTKNTNATTARQVSTLARMSTATHPTTSTSASTLKTTSRFTSTDAAYGEENTANSGDIDDWIILLIVLACIFTCVFILIIMKCIKNKNATHPTKGFQDPLPALDGGEGPQKMSSNSVVNELAGVINRNTNANERTGEAHYEVNGNEIANKHNNSGNGSKDDSDDLYGASVGDIGGNITVQDDITAGVAPTVKNEANGMQLGSANSNGNESDSENIDILYAGDVGVQNGVHGYAFEREGYGNQIGERNVVEMEGIDNIDDIEPGNELNNDIDVSNWETWNSKTFNKYVEQLLIENNYEKNEIDDLMNKVLINLNVTGKVLKKLKENDILWNQFQNKIENHSFGIWIVISQSLQKL